jgi:hypothetical protein
MRFESAKASGGDPRARYAISLGAGLPSFPAPSAPSQHRLWLTTQCVSLLRRRNGEVTVPFSLLAILAVLVALLILVAVYFLVRRWP